MLDFSQPGSDGPLPYELNEWRWGVTCTVRPELAEPIEPGRQYLLNANVRRRVSRGEDFAAFGDLYERARAIARQRINELKGPEQAPLYSWIASHAWGRVQAGPLDFVFAVLTTCVADLPEKDRPQGEREPSTEELSAPGGETPEQSAARHASGGTRNLSEIYSDFDFRDGAAGAGEAPPAVPEAPPAVPMFSYGEYVPSCGRAGYELLVRRAERRAALHHALLTGSTFPAPLRMVCREWFCATNPDIAVAHIYFQV